MATTKDRDKVVDINCMNGMGALRRSNIKNSYKKNDMRVVVLKNIIAFLNWQFCE